MKRPRFSRRAENDPVRALLAVIYDNLAARMLVALYRERDTAVRELGVLRPLHRKPAKKKGRKNQLPNQ